ncbi:Uncharacterised protein [Corynebacterium kutscheri]|uniref:Transcriptional regulator, AlpA family n=1 Tax=Corynebacterium kutscheri TaxID=35755 RepID=A0A0F6QZT5_9CORY|nr:hypothetical protein [Corynebacterium kutscheri]AKE40885.1 hypothetical protein UL82_03370 [Corynebacterium kutscheri]VEH06653.1 Uncharacterised protein [Corynebacterium kutscheri]VEH09182.1 Uncharacterised protein [Corynebacterium kutscheri]VEH82585.1 Uncharacterised protein [Corynebacterium kutscheri]
MNPKIIDSLSGRELWTAVDCAKFSGTARGTFTSYAGRGRAPAPVAKLHGLTLWDSEAIIEWTHARKRAKIASAAKNTIDASSDNKVSHPVD